MKITNISDGPRGFWNNGRLVVLEAGEVRNADLPKEVAKAIEGMPEYFDIDGMSKAEDGTIHAVVEIDGDDEPTIDDLRAQAEELGIDVDNRWGEKRLMTEIDKKLAV